SGKSVGYEEVQRFEGAFTGVNKKVVIGILVARFKDRFTEPATERAKVARSNGYNLILTDEKNIYSDLITFIKSHRNNSSNNERKIEGMVDRLELERIELKLGNELMWAQIENVRIKRENELLRRENR
ncbi:4430_t:CDS:1, partial [Paraglomus occultum]